MSDTAERLRLYARQFEDLHAPQNVTIGMREAADEIERLREALEELIWYVNQLELVLYDPDDWPKTHGVVAAARAALEGK